MTVVDELVAVLGYKIEGGDKLKEFQTGLDQAEQGASKATAAISGTAKALGVGLSGAAAVAFGKKALTQFADFELVMTRIGIAAGASAEEVAGASNDVQRLAQRFAMPIDQATAGLDTLTASGMSLKDAMSFLPSVLATAQASGASTIDIANTIQKASTTLGITAGDAQKAFDIMVAGGKAGQFELKDMAQYLPTLSSQFSMLGYSGNEGLRRLIVLMQLMREKTGSSSEAATQLSNVMQKIYSNETQNAFGKMGVDLEARMKEAIAGGEDTISAFTRITRETINGDLTQLPKLFADAQFQQGMVSLVKGADAMERFTAALRNVDGSTMVDLNKVLVGTDAKLQQLSTSYERFMNAAGAALATPVGGALDALSSDLDYGEAIRAQLEKEGMSYWARENWMFMHSFDQKGKDEKARLGGYTGPVTQNRRTPGVPIFPDQIAEMRDRLGTGTASQVDRSGAPNATMADIEALLDKRQSDGMEAVNARLSELSRSLGSGAAPVVTDNRQDNRSTTVNITQNVQQASQAPRAAAEATGRAVAGVASPLAAPQARLVDRATGWGGPR